MSFFRKLGRAIDPTSSKSAFGAVTRQAIAAVPGGSAVMNAVVTGKGLMNSKAPRQPAPKNAAVASPTAAPGYEVKPSGMSPTLLLGAAAVAAALFFLAKR